MAAESSLRTTEPTKTKVASEKLRLPDVIPITSSSGGIGWAPVVETQGGAFILDRREFSA